MIDGPARYMTTPVAAGGARGTPQDKPGSTLALLHQRVCLAVILVVAVALLLPLAAGAHPFLVRTTPRAGERLADGPAELVLQFSEAIRGGERLALRTFDGRAVPLPPPEPLAGGAGMRATVPALEEGAYLVAWQMLGRDGDLAAGEFAFAVGSAPLATTGATSAAVAWPNAAASWLFLGGLVVALGGLASELFVWRPLARGHGLAVPRAPVVPGLLVALAGAAAALVLLVAARADAAGRWLEAGTWTAALGTRPGLLSAGALLLVAYALWVAPLRQMRGWALVPLGGAALVAAWRGHSGLSSEAGFWWAAPANALHLLGAGTWAGALLHLVLVLWRAPRGALQEKDLRADAARRYAGLALPTALLVLAGGVAAAAAEFAEPAQLFTTAYGRVLLLKLALVAAVLALALAARLRALPADARGGVRLLRRLTAAEVAAMVAVLGVTGVLINATRPRAAAAEVELLGPPPVEAPLRLAGQAGALSVFLAAAEGQVQVQVIPTSDNRQVPGPRVELAGSSPTGANLSLYPRPCGVGCAAMGFDWPTGTTRIRVTASARDWEGGTVEFAVPWPPLPEDPALLDRVIAAMRAQPRLWMTERVSSGPTAKAGGAPYPIDGAVLMDSELYTASGATDIRPLPSDDSSIRVLTFYLPGSAIWYRQELDPTDRILRETIVNPGHLIERTFSYGVDPPGSP